MSKRAEFMRNRNRMLLPILLTSMLLLIQSGPTNLLNKAPITLMSDDSNECLTFTNVSHDYNYSQPSQYSFNISADMVNNCSDDIMYPSTLIENDTVGIETSSDDSNWRYIIGGNSSYHVEWEVTRSQDIADGTFVTFDLHPTRDNCHVNCTESQNYSFRMVIAIGPIDISTCYGIGDIHHDYDANLSQNSFNLTAELNNSCPGDIHYPQGILWNDTAGVASSPPGGVGNYGMSAYMIFSNTSTNATWYVTLDSNITNGTYVTFTIEPVCWMYTLDPMYMQDCIYTPLNSKELVIHIGSQEPVNQSNNTSDSDGDSIPDSDDDCPNTPAGTAVNSHGCPEDTDGDSIPDSDDDCPNTPAGTAVDSHGCPEESIYIWPDDVGGYAGRAHNYGLAFNTTMNSVITLYEVDHLASNTTYRIEWYISNGSAPPYVASGNLTTDDVNNTGYATPLHSALNLSNDCYTIWAELYDDAGVLRDDDEFTFCFVLTGNVMAWHTEHYNNGYDQNFFGIDAALEESYPSFFTLGQVVTIHVDGTSYDYFISHLTGAGNNMSGIEHDNVRYLYLIDPDGTRAHGWEHGWVLEISDTFTIDGRNTTNQTFDGDGDGILDSEDDCPNTPTGTAVGYHGCPEEDTGADNGSSEEEENSGEVESGFVPGFGLTLGICALMGAALSRRKL